jgi:hypothetical protein
MTQIAFKAGATFSYMGTVSGLDPTVAWGASAGLRRKGDGTPVDPPFTVTLQQAPDFATSKSWALALFMSAADTAKWWDQMTRGELVFDIKFFNTAGADPVIVTPATTIKITGRVL